MWERALKTNKVPVIKSEQATDPLAVILAEAHNNHGPIKRPLYGQVVIGMNNGQRVQWKARVAVPNKILRSTPVKAWKWKA